MDRKVFIFEQKDSLTMRLKKTNAVIALISVFLLFFHICCCIFSYSTGIYKPALVRGTAYILAGFMLLHGVLAMCSLKRGSDGSSIRLYRKLNIMTVIQRVTAALIIPMLVLHVNTFHLLEKTSQSGQRVLFILVLIFQPLFYAVMLMHTAPSVSRALITLGILTSPSRRRIIDRISYAAAAVLFAAASIVIIRMELIMFAAGGL